MEKKGKILIVDDNEDILFSLNALLLPHVEKIRVAKAPENISRFLAEFTPDVILLDMNFRKDAISGVEGFEWLERIMKTDPEAVVIPITAYGDTEKVVMAMKAGAADFITKPWDNDKLLATVNSALKLRESRKEIVSLKNQVEVLSRDIPSEIIGESSVMNDIFSLLDKIADTDANVLILGENGTGKDLIARAIHNDSRRASSPFVNIDLGTIAESLFESELFGYEKGAFTDARKDKKGWVEMASGGTLFLDEIGNLSPAMQIKMLTVLEKRYVSPLGSTVKKPVDVRLISATNSDIYGGVGKGTFRQDLLYRINTIEIHMPPLRERGNDIILIAEHFIRKFREKHNKDLKGFAPDACKKLLSYHWPGNVRELQNIVERTVILSSGSLIYAEDLIMASGDKVKKDETLNLEMVEQDVIQKAIRRSGGNLNKAAELLGITRFSLYRKIKRK